MATIAASGAVRSANVVTITTTGAHGLSAGAAANVAGVTDGTFNGIYYIVSAPSGTTFTYSQIGSNGTSGSGTTAPVRQMFSLGVNNASLGSLALNVVFWYPVSTPLPLVGSTGSIVSTNIAHPPTGAEIAAITAGILVEESINVTLPGSWAQGANLAKTETFLQDLYVAKLAARNLLPQPGSVLGFWYDGTAWQQ